LGNFQLLIIFQVCEFHQNIFGFGPISPVATNFLFYVIDKDKISSICSLPLVGFDYVQTLPPKNF